MKDREGYVPVEKQTAAELRANLNAANQEVSNVMHQNSQLKKEADEAYQNGYRDALQALDNLSRIVQTQAGMVTYLMGMLTGGLKSR